VPLSSLAAQSTECIQRVQYPDIPCRLRARQLFVIHSAKGCFDFVRLALEHMMTCAEDAAFGNRFRALAVLLVLSGCQMAENKAGASDSPAAQAGAPARPGYFAELEELEAARKAGTLAAYDLFLARHPKSRYAVQARRERAALAAR
jgi:hypothetical protein